MTTHVFITGSKGIPARYGGFETFVDNLTKYKGTEDIFYHVSCMNNDEKHFTYHGADCFNVRVPLRGAPGRILHVSEALRQIEGWKKSNPGEKGVVYILGCRIGPLLFLHAKKLQALDMKIVVNPDGLEWKRGKWNGAAKLFLRYCEACLVKNADFIICDSLHIKKYIAGAYPFIKEKTAYIPYGADLSLSEISDTDDCFTRWKKENAVRPFEYYLIVGRFVPENNYETIIREFTVSDTKKKLIIITNYGDGKFYRLLKKRTKFQEDKRICFAGTVYEKELLKKIREQAFAYIHGHEVGGTNPSLLEALAGTKLNLLLDTDFNREAGRDGALYWKKGQETDGSLKTLISHAEQMGQADIEAMGKRAKTIIEKHYSWHKVCQEYEELLRRF